MAEAIKKKVPPRINIYTALTFLAVVVLAVGIGFLMNYSPKVSGESSAWFVAPRPGATK